MTFGKRRVTPMNAMTDIYAERANASLSVYNAELTPPATSYASTKSALSSRLAMPTVGPKVRAFFKSSQWRMNGLVYNWSWGSLNQNLNTASLPGGGGMDGTVRSTNFQPVLVQLHDWQTNRNWYVAWGGTGGGVFTGSKPERYAYPSFRVAQIDTSTTGGPGTPTQRMQSSPRFTAVQRIRRFQATPRYYDTVSRNTGRRNVGGSSNRNTPGV